MNTDYNKQARAKKQKMTTLLQDLKDTKLVRVTGSYAVGEQNETSDVDFYVTPDHPEQPYTERNMLKIIEVLDRHGVRWHSTVVGYISTIHDDNPTLLFDLEFSDLFHRRKGRLKEVEIEGVIFKTY